MKIVISIYQYNTGNSLIGYFILNGILTKYAIKRIVIKYTHFLPLILININTFISENVENLLLKCNYVKNQPKKI